MRNDSNIPEKRVIHLLFCVVVVSFIFHKDYTIFDATVQKFLLKAVKSTAHTFFQKSWWASDNVNVLTSNVSNLTSKIANASAEAQDSHHVGFIFYFLHLLDFCALHQEYCSALTIGHDV